MSEAATIWRAEVPDVRALTDAWAAAAPDWVYAERLEDLTLCRAGALLPQLSLWPCGRAFNAALELRWQETPGGYRLTLLAEAKILSLLVDPAWQTELVCDQVTPRFILLWGEYDRQGESQTWSTTQIPRPLAYPVDGQQERVRLAGVDYRRQGVVVATRLCGLAGDSAPVEAQPPVGDKA